MRRFALLAALCVVGVLAQAGPAWSCSCAASTPFELAEQADVIFTGTVGSIDRPRSFRIAHVDVETVFKGAVPREVEVTTTSSGSSCGFHFDESMTYTVFADADRSDSLSTSICTATTRGTIDPEKYGLPGGYPPEAGRDPDLADTGAPLWVWVWPAGLGSVLLGGLALLLSRRRA